MRSPHMGLTGIELSRLPFTAVHCYGLHDDLPFFLTWYAFGSSQESSARPPPRLTSSGEITKQYTSDE